MSHQIAHLRLGSLGGLACSYQGKLLQQQLGAPPKQLTQQLRSLDDVIHRCSFLGQNRPSIHGPDSEGQGHARLLHSSLDTAGYAW